MACSATLPSVIIDPQSPEHPYVQVAAILRRRIQEGEITSMLPSLTQLTEETGLAMNTVRRAVKILTDEGLVYTVPGRGTFVRAK
jgi:GntR family transcriptional regulator